MLLILAPNNKEEVISLGKAATALGWDVYKAHSSWRLPEHLKGKRGAVYGEQFFCEIIAEQMNWKLQSNSLDWLAKLPEEYLHRKVNFTNLLSARNETSKKFIKPADDKCFDAKVYDSGKDLTALDILDSAPVLISDVMTFTSEYRCFIKNRKVITASCYIYKGDINKEANWYVNNDAVVSMVDNMLADTRVECVSGSVIDVGRFKKDTYAVIETNPAWASGIYGCEIAAVLDVLKSSCIMEN